MSLCYSFEIRLVPLFLFAFSLFFFILPDCIFLTYFNMIPGLKIERCTQNSVLCPPTSFCSILPANHLCALVFAEPVSSSFGLFILCFFLKNKNQIYLFPFFPYTKCKALLHLVCLHMKIYFGNHSLLAHRDSNHSFLWLHSIPSFRCTLVYVPNPLLDI